LAILVCVVVVHAMWISYLVYNSVPKKKSQQIESPPETLKSNTETMQSTQANPGATNGEGDVEWTVEADPNDPWSMENDDWGTDGDAEPEAPSDPFALADSGKGSQSNYYDYVAQKRASSLPYEQKGIAELYVEDLEFLPTEFNEFDDTAEFAY